MSKKVPRKTRQNEFMFELEPMLGKPITMVPGVGEVISRQLATHGITTADELLGWWLVNKRDETLFWTWMQNHCPTCKKGMARRIHQAFEDWSHYFL